MVTAGSSRPNQLFAKRLWLPSSGLQRGWRMRAEWSLRELLIRVCAVMGLCVSAAAAHAQTATAEVDFTVGVSSDETSAAALQARVFGATKSDWRGYAEVNWAGTHKEYASDAFGAAYPYDGRARVMEAFGEKTFRAGRSLLGVRAGRYRTPFGISGRRSSGTAPTGRCPTTFSKPARKCSSACPHCTCRPRSVCRRIRGRKPARPD